MNPCEAALRNATTAAWDDNQRRWPYPSRQAFETLPAATQASWLADHRTAILTYLRERRDAEHTRNGRSARWWALAWEVEQLEASAPS